jgi:regulator of sigma E protease
VLVVGLTLFVLLVIVHEWGHFIAARRNGVEVEEFGIGFPPRLVGRRFKGSKTLISLNLLPLGGFVRLKGEYDEAKSRGSFGGASYRAKLKIILAGVAMNLLVAYLIILFLSFSGLPKLVEGQFSIHSDEHYLGARVVAAQVAEGGAAANAGMARGDVIKSIDGESIDTEAELRQLSQQRAGQSVNVEWQHQEKEKSTQIKFGDGGQHGYLGVTPVDASRTRYSWSAPLVAAGVSLQMVGLTFLGLFSLLGGLFRGQGAQATENAVGPVGIFVIFQNIGDFGLTYLLFLIASISATLAVVNTLPFPGLDGGRMALITVARVWRRRVPEKLENLVHGIGFLLLLALAVIISYFDVKRFF